MQWQPQNIQDRTEEYALRAIKLFQHLRKQKNEDGWIIGRQYLRAAMSIGANLVEAHAGETRKDFIHKCAIALKEARESRYWLRLLLRAKLVDQPKLSELLDETDQIVRIVASIIVNTKKNGKS